MGTSLVVSTTYVPTDRSRCYHYAMIGEQPFGHCTDVAFVEGLAYLQGWPLIGFHSVYVNCYRFVLHFQILILCALYKDANLIDCYVTMFLFQIQKLGGSYKFSIDSDPLTSGGCRFINGSGRGVTGLVSFPGSGNTWVRELLQTVTGIYVQVHIIIDE